MSFELVKPIELLKNNIKFTQNKKAKFEKLLNFSEIGQKWLRFKKEKLPNIDFFNQIKEKNEQAANDFIKTGDTEFSDEARFKEILDKNLFYHILLKANTVDDLEDYSFTQYSQLFPNQDITVKVSKTKVLEDDDTIAFRLRGKLQKEKLLNEVLEKQYDEIYKPLLKYSFTEFDFVYRIDYTLEAKTGLIIDAKASLSESIKNNFVSIIHFELKRVDL